MFKRSVLGVSLCLLSQFSLANSVENHDPLVNGDVVDQEKYPAIIWIGNCTATVVGPRVILTAAHCNHGSDVSIQIHGSMYTVAMISSPHYERSFQYFSPSADLYTNSDLAVGFLDRPVDITPVSVGGEAKLGQKGLLFGYGCNDRWGQHRDGELRAGENQIAKATKNGMLMKGIKDGASGCPGDSGGPTLVESAHGELQLLGIHSQVGFADDNSRLNETWDARTDLPIARDFLKDIATLNHADICGVTINCSQR